MKNSFTLLETVFSLTIIVIMLGSMFNLITQYSSYDKYNDIQNAKNQFLINSSQTNYNSEYILLERRATP